ncbi:MAG: acylneuraminate cytidylyltransferase family protein [Patescibacteria group bacterium]
MKYLVIIPARGGSKGIKDKNIIDVKGKPLIWYSINAANKLVSEGLVSEVVVSTDNEKIAEIARECGGNVPFLRPAEISGDKAKSIDFVLHALNFYEQQGLSFDAVIILQPIAPLRTFEDIKEAVILFNKNKVDSLISVYEEEGIDDLVLYYRDGDRAVPLNANHNNGNRRQDAPKIYMRNGAIYIARTDFIKTGHKLIADQPLMLEMPKERSINLDEPKDLEKLKEILCK